MSNLVFKNGNLVSLYTYLFRVYENNLAFFLSSLKKYVLNAHRVGKEVVMVSIPKICDTPCKEKMQVL